MSENRYFLPGLAAIALAILFPAYWIAEISWSTMDASAYGVANGFNPLDLLFLLVGALNIYFYLSLRRILFDHHHFQKLNVVFATMIGICVAFYLGTFVVDGMTHQIGNDLADGIIAIITLISIIAFGVLDIIMGIVLLRQSETMSSAVRIFGGITLMQGIFEVSVIFSVLALVIFPLAVVFIAVHFLRTPEMIEVV